MKILLLGDYSNVHWTLAEGLRFWGHEVTVVSDGDGWKNYRRDISLKRCSLGKIDTCRYLFDVLKLWPTLKGYDVVQLINPVFLSFRGEHIKPFYRMLRHNNGALFMGAFGMDYYWVKAGMDCHTFRYSDFNLGAQVRHGAENDQFIRDWLYGSKGRVNQYIANDCDGIVAGLYEYDVSYRPYFPDKLRFIPFPINTDAIAPITPPPYGPIRFFIGIQHQRSVYKGTDIMLRALERVVREYPDRAVLVKAESVPYEEYQTMMDTSHVMLDQLYSYTPAMNALLGMAKGLVVVGGGEPENYSVLHETELHPIVNVEPNEESVYQSLCRLVLNPVSVRELSRQSVAYIQRHHHYIKVAESYLAFWSQCHKRTLQ